jgi:MFS family permease
MTPNDRGNAPRVPMSYVYRIIAMFCLGWMLVYADRTALYPMLPAIGQQFGLSATQTGAITSAYFLCYVLMQIPAGVLADRIGPKRVLVAMYGLAGIGLLLTGWLATSYTTLLGFVALYGLGAGAFYSTGYGTAMQTVPARLRGLSSAIINSGMSLGLALGLIAAGPLYLATSNWRAPFLALAVPTIVMAAVYGLELRDLRATRQSGTGLREVLRDWNLIAIDLAGFCSLYGFWVVLTWGPSFLQTERGISLGASGLYTAVIAFAAIPAALTVGPLSDRIGRKRLALVLFPLAAVCILGLATVRSHVALILVLLAYGLTGKLAQDPVQIAWLTDHALASKPQALGAAIGVYSFSAMSSSVVAPLVSGWIKDQTGSLDGAFYLGALIVLAGVGLTWLTADLVARPPQAVVESVAGEPA